MDVFKDAWERNVRLLTEAVDDITTIDDFLAVSGEKSTSCAKESLAIELRMVRGKPQAQSTALRI